MPTSNEFVALCRSQVNLLTNGLGASLSAVYLTDEVTDSDGSQMIPVVLYPETLEVWQMGMNQRSLPSRSTATMPSLQPVSGEFFGFQATPEAPARLSPGLDDPLDQDSTREQDTLPASNALVRQAPIVVPLIHEEVVMGFLVAGRDDRPWNDPERSQIERIAQTLALACVLDQRSQWLEHRLHQRDLLQAQQYDLFHNLLHQFRNPLTALKTFGKLLLKRLTMDDPNRSIATNIVQESDRLKELLQQFDQAIDLTNTHTSPLLLQAATDKVNLASDRLAGGGVALPQTISTNSADPVPALLPPASPLTGLKPTLELCSVEPMLLFLLSSASAIAQDRNLILQADLAPDLPFVNADPAALREVLTNLIDNALKYTPAGGQVLVQARRLEQKQLSQGDTFQPEVNHDRPEASMGETNLADRPSEAETNSAWLVIAVSDNGPGIPPADQARLFERHYRGVQAQSDIPGTGLGLAIARDLVRQMNGDIQVFSPALTTLTDQGGNNSDNRSGTTFIVFLPL